MSLDDRVKVIAQEILSETSSAAVGLVSSLEARLEEVLAEMEAIRGRLTALEEQPARDRRPGTRKSADT